MITALCSIYALLLYILHIVVIVIYILATNSKTAGALTVAADVFQGEAAIALGFEAISRWFLE